MSNKIKLKLDLSTSKNQLKKQDLPSTMPRTTVHKSFDKSALVSKIIPKLAISTLHSRENSALLTTSRAKLESSRILKENPQVTSSRLALSKRNSVSKESEIHKRPIESLKLPMAPTAVIRNFKSQLTLWEQGEILEYPEVYFYGQKACKIKSNIGLNNGFDDDRNDYKVHFGDHIAYRYEIIQQLGKGSFGQVFRVLDHKEKQMLALKIIRNKSRFHQQGAVEVKVLQKLKENDTDDTHHIIHIKDFFCFREHLCITFELLSINLYEFLKSNSFNGLSLSLIKRFTFQLLQALKLSDKLNIIHCDLKPENILLKQSSKSCVKVIDFGSSCFNDKKIYSYIQSRFYRAPEIILGVPYTTAIDMWSLGCIITELYTGVPLFPGENELDQLLCIMEIRGTPPTEVMKVSTRSKLFFEEEAKPKILPNSRGKRRVPGSKSLSDVLIGTDKIYQDFVNRCLDWNPNTRITPEGALGHPWLADVGKTLNTPRHSVDVRKQKLSGMNFTQTMRNSKTSSFVF